MIFRGEELMKAWKDLEGTEPVTAAEVASEPLLLVMAESGGRMYEASDETINTLLPLMRSVYTTKLKFDGVEYRGDGHLCNVSIIRANGKQYIQFPQPIAEEITEIYRLKTTIQSICTIEQERIAANRAQNARK